MAEKASVRRLIDTADDIVVKGYEGGMDANQMLDYAESGIFEISQLRQKGQYAHIRDVLISNIEIIDKASQMEGGLTGITTGFKYLDTMTSGLQKSLGHDVQPGDVQGAAGTETALHGIQGGHAESQDRKTGETGLG